MRRAIVVGGGIGGLTAALSLRSKGWRVEVHERAEALENVGSGLAVASNALRALDTIGLGERVRDLEAFQGYAAGVRTWDGRWLMRTDQEAAVELFGDTTVVLKRPRLVSLLAGELDDGELLLGSRVRSVDAEKGLVATDSGEREADLVVAADGIRSSLRRSLLPEHPGPVYSGQVTWRTVVPHLPENLTATEFWGRGRLVATMPLSSRETYVYASALLPERGKAPDEKRLLLDMFDGWAEPVGELLEKAEPEKVLRNDVYFMETPIPRMSVGKVAFLGDAAHGMTPNLGQGACQAIEDAVVLAHHLDKGTGLDGYDRDRRPRTAMVVKRSKRTQDMALQSNPAAVAIRNAGVRLVSRFAARSSFKSLAPVLGWRPPAD
ncbi:FAD-dependent monooxygenase [Salininema proteolyticum]|uniref:FAD-dependent monooxygenase n=1 Tax=Salininema proteolyticum TaxID=1607685 RepID=A0ABV8TYB5_9ACTN